MTKRVRVQQIKGGGSYFAAPKSNVEFISTGCKTFDLALGGGWAEDRIANIIGDKSTGKTLLCIESAANFHQKHPDGKIYYRECEAAFDTRYAVELGMPVDAVDFGEPLETIEDMFEDLNGIVERAKKSSLYILDSLDSLTDRSEMERSMDQGSYGAEKAKKLSQLFRRLVRKLSSSHVSVIIVSQIRDKIGVTFGKKTTRSGGKALDFYASQVVTLAQVKTVKRTVSGIERPEGISIKARVDKNKISLPFREAEFDLLFGFGVDDLGSCLEWLKTVNSLNELGIDKKAIKRFSRKLYEADDDVYQDKLAEIHEIVERRWYEIEQSFMPKRRKYKTAVKEYRKRVRGR